MSLVAGPHPSEVYAQQLYRLAYGYPLWEPEPKEGQGEVEIGDVGYLRQGGFYRLFNAMKAPDDKIQHLGVPADFQMHDPGRMRPVEATNTINAGPLFSSTVRHIKVESDVGTSVFLFLLDLAHNIWIVQSQRWRGVSVRVH